MLTKPRVVVWADSDQAALVRDVVRSTGIDVVAIGSSRPQAGSDLAKSMSVQRIDDLRQTRRTDIDLLWLATAEPMDSNTRRRIGEEEIPTISCEPQFGSMAELMSDARRATNMSCVPMMRHSAAFRAAADLLPQFGEPQCVNISGRSGPGQGTLFARLFDAMDLLHALCGPIESINASLAGPLQQTPDGLAALRGHMCLNVRFKPNRCACVAVSDQAGSWFRGLTILGDGGCLRINDQGHEWIDPSGRVIDQQQSHAPPTFADLICAEVKTLCHDRERAEPPDDTVLLLALCEAARLSCLTAQCEAPERLMEMMSRP